MIKPLFSLCTLCCFLKGLQALSLDEKIFQVLEEPEEVARILEAGGNVNAVDPRSGQTPLMASVLRGYADAVRFLLTETDADPSIPEKDGYTPAHGAGFQGRAAIMKFLHEQGIDVMSDYHEDGYLPLHRACWGRAERHADTVRVLLELGVDPKVPSRNGKTCHDMSPNRLTLDVLDEYIPASESDEL